MTPEIGDYPVRAMSVTAGDRFLLYTDGVTESQDINGDFFGDARLEQVVRSGESCTPAELSERLLAGIQQWRPASVSQQDDITLIVIDVAP